MKMSIGVFSVLIGIATSLSLAAKTVPWPEKNPYFSMTIPDGWTCTPDADGDLKCAADDKSGVRVDATITKWTTEEQMNARMAALPEKLAQALKLKNAENSKVSETTNSQNVKLWRAQTAGLSDETELRSWVVAFRTENNPFVTLTGVVMKGDEAHDKMIEQIIDSIAPINSKADTKPGAQGFDPYKGSVAALLPAEFSDSVIKYKRTSVTDKTSVWKENGAVEAVSFSYNAVAMVIVKIDGGLVNFPTSAEAGRALRVLAAQYDATVVPKGNELRFVAPKRRMVGWTNGSIMCLVTGGTDPAAGNFEKVAPF